MMDDGKKRFWKRAYIAFTVGVWIYIFYLVYAMIQIGEEFKAGMD